MKNYRAGFRVGSSVGRHLKKGVERLKEHAAKKEAKKVQAGKDKIQKSEMGYAEGGRTGLKKGGPKPGTHDYFLLHKREKKKEGGRTGHVERVGGGPEGKPHSTKAGRIAAGVRKIKRGTRISKDLVQDVFNVVARKHSLGQQGKPHSSKEGRTASFGRTKRDVKKIFSPEREKKAGGGALLKQTVKKVAKKIKAKKDTESVKDVR